MSTTEKNAVGTTRTGAPRPRTTPVDDQKRARIFGVLFVLTFVTSIPAALLFQPVVADPAGFLAGAGSDTLVRLGVLLEFLLIIANIGTAVVLYPIAKRQNEILAIGYVTARVMESAFIAAGIIFVLGIVSLRHDAPGAIDVAASLAALKGWTFVFGPGLVVPFGNGMILGYLMYRSGLIPRPLAVLGLVAGPVLLVETVGVLFGWWELGGLVGLMVAPEFAWELLLGIYAAIWGFRRSAPILSVSAQ
jgi:hypothetical protein